VLDAVVGVLPELGELHAPAIDHGADRQVEGHHRRSKFLRVVGLRAIEDQLEQPEAAAGELVGAEGVRARFLLHGVAEGLLDLLALGPQGLEAEAGAGLEQGEHAVGVVAERLAEVAAAVPRRAGVDERLEQEVLLLGLAPEEHAVVAEADVVNDVRIQLLHLQDRRGHVVERLPVVILEHHLLHPELGLGPLTGRFGHALTVRRVLGQEGDLDLIGLQIESRRQVLGDELDVVPAEPGRIDLGAIHVLEAAFVEAGIDAGGLPVDDIVARRHLARRAAEPRGERAGDDLDAFSGDQPIGFAGRHRGIGGVGHGEHELLTHDAAALVDQVADDLETFHVALALERERPGDRLEDSDAVLARGGLPADGGELSAEDHGEGGDDERDDEAWHTKTSWSGKAFRRDGRFVAPARAKCQGGGRRTSHRSAMNHATSASASIGSRSPAIVAPRIAGLDSGE